MCGRARCTLTAQQVAQACGLKPRDASSVPTQNLDRYRPSYNVAPGASLPVYRVQRSSTSASSGVGGEAATAAVAEPIVHCMKWGLIPSFTKKNEKPDHYRMFNARSESIREKASFRRLIPNNRCLVAVEGFYEWKKDGSKKQPYYIHFKDNQPLVFAALYDSWENSEGEIIYTFTILTTHASSALEWLHAVRALFKPLYPLQTDRMPVIFRDIGSINLWLNDFSGKHENILGPCEDPYLVWYPVAPAMGKPSFDGPECIKEIQLKPDGEKPLLKFFTKKTEVKCQSEPEATEVKCQTETEVVISSKQEHALHNPKEEQCTEDNDVKITEENRIAASSCGVKREFEEMETASGLACENIHSKQIRPAKKKGEAVKTTGDKQSSLLSYFGKR